MTKKTGVTIFFNCFLYVAIVVFFLFELYTPIMNYLNIFNTDPYIVGMDSTSLLGAFEPAFIGEFIAFPLGGLLIFCSFKQLNRASKISFSIMTFFYLSRLLLLLLRVGHITFYVYSSFFWLSLCVFLILYSCNFFHRLKQIRLLSENSTNKKIKSHWHNLVDSLLLIRVTIMRKHTGLIIFLQSSIYVAIVVFFLFALYRPILSCLEIFNIDLQIVEAAFKSLMGGFDLFFVGKFIAFPLGGVLVFCTFKLLNRASKISFFIMIFFYLSRLVQIGGRLPLLGIQLGQTTFDVFSIFYWLSICVFLVLYSINLFRRIKQIRLRS